MTDFLVLRPACCAAAGFAAVSFIGYFAAADADPTIAGFLKLAAAALFFAAGAVSLVLAIRAGYPKKLRIRHTRMAQPPQASSCGESENKAAPRRRLYASIAALLFACAIAALVSQLHFGRPARLLEKYGDGIHTVTFTVLDIERISSYDASYYVEISAIDDSSVGPSKVYALLDADYILDLDTCKIYTLDNIVLSLPEYSTLSEAAYGASRGIMLTLHSETDPGGAVPACGERAMLRCFFRRLNTVLSQRLVMALGKSSGEFASCLLLGRWDSLTGTISRDFRTLGILHLLAISGEHLSILLGALEMLLRGLNKYIRFALLACGAVAIYALTGMSPAVARASTMAVLYYAAFLLRRRADGPTSLFVAVAAIIAASPAAAADIGLLMSMCATLGIMAARSSRTTRKNPRLRMPSFLRESFISSLYATVFTLPVSWLVCGEFSPLAPLATLVFTLPVTALLYILPLVLLFYGTPLSLPLEFAAGVLCELVRVLSQTLARPASSAVISLRYPFVWIAFAAAAVALLILPRIKPVFAGGAAIAAAAVAFAAAFAIALGIWSGVEAGAAKVIYYNSGTKNDMLVIDTRGAALICDVSDGTYTPLKNAVRLARTRLYATKIDGYVLTHLHRRHVMQYMRMASRYFVDALILPRPQTEAERHIALALEEAAGEFGTRAVYYNAAIDTQVELHSLSLLLPARLYTKRSSHPVVALYVSGAELLYIGGGNGDVPREREELIESWAQAAKCVIFGAHSPSYYSLADTVRFPRAELAIYPSAEVKKSYGIPDFGSRQPLILGETGHDSIQLNFKLSG